MQELIRALEQTKLQFSPDEPMRDHTSFRIGGPVAVMVFPRDETQVVSAVQIVKNTGQTPLILGNGSNILAGDAPLVRAVIKLCNGEDGVVQLERRGEREIYAAAGVLLSRAAVFAQKAGLAGLAFAHGIPGSIGGAVRMNAGAYGGEMAQVVRSVRYLDTNTGKIQTISGADLAFAYRHSRFTNSDDVILGASLMLKPGSPAEIRAEMDDLAARRSSSQPLNLPSAGSAFKRPQNGYAAALIDEAGLKGYSIGGAKISEKHAGFIVNQADATCNDVLRLMAHIQETVFAKTGIQLESEVEVIQGN